jgi:hypothetical protein
VRLIALLTLLVCLPAFADPPVDVPLADAGVIVPLETGEKAPFPGLLFPEQLAEQTFADKVDLKKLRREYEADKEAWAKKEDAYKKQVEVLKPTFWSEYKGQIGLVSGFVLGAATVVVVVFAVNKAQQP